LENITSTGKVRPGNFENRHAAEKIGELGGVERGRRDDELEVVAARHYLAQDAE
jgi:hypothetical protein